ncbi:sulfotransferase family 2 domain-containing protein [Desulfosediminicola flagellatus]|uniref:sulfotransferase family 2 domain-containing protein n=1 Tax=Desulfosediminicola flagellatus TaxID=2569541 RepID=UPI0010ACD04B|nr:sulfotransferase family 2 domain-containing protein [Desulfosediminicola flagellatus]
MYKQKYRLLRKFGVRQKNITKHDLATCSEKKFFFIHVPKTAGKSLRLSLFGQANGARHCSALHIKRCYPHLWSDSFTFCFVRNPYDRLYSAYKYLNSGGNSQNNDLQFKSRILCNVNSFEEFVCDWLTSDRVYAYTHFIPQYEFIYQNDECLVDHIGKFENLEEEYEVVRDKLNLPDRLMHLNRSEQKAKTAISDVYSSAMARKVEEIYRKDFMLLGYRQTLEDC